MKDIGERLQARARELGLTDSEVARRLGLAQNRYSAYVNGRREPDLRLFAKICVTLRLTPNDVLVHEAKPETRTASPARIRADFILDGLMGKDLELAVRLLAAIEGERSDRGAAAVQRRMKVVGSNRQRAKADR